MLKVDKGLYSVMYIFPFTTQVSSEGPCPAWPHYPSRGPGAGVQGVTEVWKVPLPGRPLLTTV